MSDTGFFGSSITIAHYFPNIQTRINGFGSPTTVTVGDNIEYNYSSNNIIADVSDQKISYRASGLWVGTSFNGDVFTDSSNSVPDIIGVTLESPGAAPITQDRITFDANNIYVNYQGLNFNNQIFVLDVQFASTDTSPPFTVAQTPEGGNIITLSSPSTLSAGLGTQQVDTVVYGTNQPLTLPDNVENVVLSGSGGGSLIKGNGLDNTFTINAGSWTIDGVSGNDTVTFTTGRAAHSVVQNANGTLTINGPEGTEQISHVGTINFSDARIGLDTSANGVEVARLYDAVLHRQADIGGANAAVAALNAGTTPLTLAQGLLTSAEGQKNFAPTLSNHDFVTALYTTVLGRAPDAGGQAAFEGALNGGASRASILLSFADSAEHVAHIGLVGQGVVHDVPLA